MLDINYLRANTEIAKQRLTKRNKYEIALIDQLLQLDDERKKNTQTALDNTLSETNATSKEIGKMMAQGQKDAAELMKNKVAELKVLSAKLEQEHTTIAENIKNLLLTLPNLPQDIVPAGKDAEDNEVVRSGGSIPEFAFTALPHWELTEKYNLINFELGNKITGSGFPVYINKGAAYNALW
jgi:seryl-tRNA synthetase